MTDTYRSPASLPPINSKKKMDRGAKIEVSPCKQRDCTWDHHRAVHKAISMAGGGRAYTLASFQEGMSVGLITAGV